MYDHWFGQAFCDVDLADECILLGIEGRPSGAVEAAFAEREAVFQGCGA